MEDNRKIEQVDKVAKTRKENLEPEDVYYDEDANVHNNNQNSYSNNN